MLDTLLWLGVGAIGAGVFIALALWLLLGWGHGADRYPPDDDDWMYGV